MKRLPDYLRENIAHLPLKTIFSPRNTLEGAFPFGMWMLSSFLFVIAVAYFREHLPTRYLEAAISEGIGPHLWNIIGSIGLVIFGLALVFPRNKLFARSTFKILESAFSMGGLTCGLVMGQLVSKIQGLSMMVEAWRLWIVGIGSFILILQVVLLHFALWFLACMARADEAGHNTLNTTVGKIALPLRLLAFLLFSVVPITLLMLER